MKTRLQALTLAAVLAATVLTGGAAISGITRRAASIARESWTLLLMRSGSFMYGPNVAGCSVSSGEGKSGRSPRKLRIASGSSNTWIRRFWWLVKNPSYATSTGNRTSRCSPIFTAAKFKSYTACGSRAQRMIQPVLSA